MRLFVFSLAALIAAPGLASAQSVLERVLGQIDGATNLAQVNGTYANIAESIGAPSTTTTTTVPATVYNAPDATELWSLNGFGPVLYVTVGDIGTTWTPDGAGGTTALAGMAGTEVDSITVNSDGTLTIVTNGTGSDVNLFDYGYDLNRALSGTGSTTYTINPDAEIYDLFGDGRGYFLTTEEAYLDNWDAGGFALTVEETITIPGISAVIDGSITNLITGVTAATAEAVAGASSATEFVMPTVDLGDLSTTALGAVNTGEITLGVNSTVDEAATTTTRAIAAAMTQIGGAADIGALVLNVAHNASTVEASVQTTMSAMNGSIASVSTTALGAVNTGTITLGVNAAVEGIVGMSGQSAAGL